MPEINGAAGKASPLRQRNKIGGNHQSGAAFIICRRRLGADTMRPHISNRLGPQRHDLPHGLPHFQIHPAAVFFLMIIYYVGDGLVGTLLFTPLIFAVNCPFCSPEPFP